MTIDNYSTIKGYVLVLGGFTDSEKLDLQIKMIIDEVLAYCYRDDVPSRMELPLADVIVSELNKLGFSELGFEGDVTSYREGDMQISLGGSSTLNGAKLKYDGKLEGFKQIIGAIKCSDTINAQ